MHALSLSANDITEDKVAEIITLDLSSAHFIDLRLFLRELNLHYKPKIITVTGTNGKGSTVAVISHILQHNHINHVCHISPHIRYFNERISYNQKHISNDDLWHYLECIYQACNQLKLKLHYHFIAFFCACLYIEHKKPDWVILEVGLGGKLDSANLFDADISIITTVALDHCEILGHSLEEIALTKAHIARNGKPIIFGDDLPLTTLNYLNEIKAIPIKAKYNPLVVNNLIHQTSIDCALNAIRQIPQQLEIPSNLRTLSVPGRFQVINTSPLIIADVAHNPQAVSHLFDKIAQFTIESASHRILALFTANQHKDITSIIQSGRKLIDLWLIPDLSQLDRRFTPIYNRQNQFPKNSLFFNNHIEAFDYVTHNTRATDLIVVFGSFVLVSALVEYYDKK